MTTLKKVTQLRSKYKKITGAFMKNWKKITLISVLSFTGVAWAGVGIVYKLANLDFTLYKNESYWGGSKAAELASFLAGGLRVQKAQEKIRESLTTYVPYQSVIVQAHPVEELPQRVFHAKSHGCVTGRLILLRDRPEDKDRSTYVGLFDTSRRESYDVMVRFSNGIGYSQPDWLPDVRGAAIKVFDVYNSKTGKNQTEDFLMTNSKTPFGKDFLEFAKFMDDVAESGPTYGGIDFTLGHPRAGAAVIGTSGLPVIQNYKVKSVATQRYWSGHPYLLGPNMAMKFNIIPTEKVEAAKSILKEWGDNYLQHDLTSRLEQREVKFIFAIQLEKNPIDTPIEDNLKEWTEKTSPSIPVAELVLDRQTVNSCDDLRFTPGHYIPEHRPLSNMGRGRLFGYEASQIGRHATEEEPGSDYVLNWRQISHPKPNEGAL